MVHVPESKACTEWKDSLFAKADDFGKNVCKHGALLAWCNDWRDHFGANRTKQNGKSTDGWTFSLLTPKERVNSIDDAAPIAIGLKNNPHWAEVGSSSRQT